MKHYLYFFLLLLLAGTSYAQDPAYPAAPVAPLNITAAEYFIDIDPGAGNGTPVAISASVNISNLAASVNVNGLSNGIHHLYLRTRSTEGRWSITNTREFLYDADVVYRASPSPAQSVIKAEYFIDTDPGTGHGTLISISPGIDVSNVPVSVNTAGLSNGIHHLFVRSLSTEGKWSLTNLTEFTVNFDFAYVAAPIAAQAVIAAEYFIDTDPGYGNGTSISVTPGIDLSSLQVPVNTNGLSTGVHHLFIRSKSNEGYWSSTNLSDFLVNSDLAYTPAPAGPQQIVAAEYFIDTDPGTGQATAIAVTPGVDINGTTVAVNTNGLSNGPHSLFIRTRNQEGRWSLTNRAEFNAGVLSLPVLEYLPGSPYNAVAGVNPSVGQVGNYTYKVLYKSSGNYAPQAGYPKVGVDLDGDQSFNSLYEGTFTMIKEGNSNDYVAGVVYSYTFNHTSNTNTAGYRFFATHEQGNVATTGVYKTGPVVTDQLSDLRIFANDISFSKNNPLPGESFTVTATITNSTAIAVTNIPVKFYRDTILIASATLPSVGAYTASTISQVLSFGTDGFYPVKVWIDSSNTLGESNVLNNYAIRPVTVGSPVLPGGIRVTTSASVQECPQLKVLVTGSAEYFGTGSATMAAGAEVTINTGTQVVTTTTDANGNFSYLLSGVTCGGNFTYSVSVTDFTFTSSNVNKTIALPCPGPSACSQPPSIGGISVSVSSAPCTNLVGSDGAANFFVKYRERDINNMWSPFDEIINQTLLIYQNGVLVQTIPSADNTHGPGEERVITLTYPLISTDPVTIRGVLTYTYVEYREIPSSIYHGIRTDMSSSSGGTIQPQLNQPDLTIQDFSQTGFTAFSFNNINVKCGNAGQHTVKVFDSIPNGVVTLIKTVNISSLEGGRSVNISHSDPNMSAGKHFLKIITDADGVVAEQDESNNEFSIMIEVPAPDLTVTEIVTSPTDLSVGSTTSFTATVKNTGKFAGAFKVQFSVNGVQVGIKKNVSSLNENTSIQVVSDPYIVTTAANTCGDVVTVLVDSDVQVAESDETNNSKQVQLSGDLAPYQLPEEDGSAGRPVTVRVNTINQFFPAIRNIGQRDVNKVTLRFTLNGIRIGADTINTVKAGELFAAHGSFTRMFSTPGDYVVKVVADTANTICETNEGNNEGEFHIRVTDSKADFEVLSQYISPSSLNPNPGQSITLVGTVRNTGGKVSQANVLRFLVDDIQLGNDVPFNALQPGKDTTVAATATYSSIITGVKVMKIVVDVANTLDEEREDNNEATRAMIVGDAPDLARSHLGSISFDPGGFVAGDSVLISYAVKNNGSQQGTAWARFMIKNEAGELVALDSTRFTLMAGASGIVIKKMLFELNKGTVITEIVNCTPMEFDLLNNNDTLAFSTVAKLKSNTTVNGDLDMKAALPEQMPEWIGGKLVLGDFDLTVNGRIINFDTAHFVVTNGTGKLVLVNSSPANTFPVGTSLSTPNFVKINNAGIQDNFSVRVAPYVLDRGNSGDTVRAGIVNRTWFLEEQIPGGSNAGVEFFWNMPDELPAFDRALCRTAHFTTSWQAGSLGAAISDTAGQFSKTQNGYTSFSPFTVTSGSGIVLPLRLLQFNVVRSGANATLSWQTSNEINTRNFAVQHSTDGRSFTGIGEVAAENTSGAHSYRFIHNSLNEGIHYYRLKMTDLDGSFTYSDIRTVRVETGTEFTVFPNPTSRSITIKGVEVAGVLEITTIDGMVLHRLTTSGTSMNVDLVKLPPGMYIIRYQNKGKVLQQKIIKN